MNRAEKIYKKVVLLVMAAVLYAGIHVVVASASTENYNYSYNLYGVELTPETVGVQTGRSCSAGASAVFKMIFEIPKEYGLRYNNPYNILRDKKAEERTLTAEHIREYISAVPLGARIRICASGDTTSNNNDIPAEGHTQILVDRTDRGFTVLECSNNTRMHATTYSWDDYVRIWNTNKGYGYIFYIMDPGTMNRKGGQGSSSGSGLTGYAQSDYGIPRSKEIYPEDEHWPLAGSVSCFYNKNRQMVLRYVNDEDGAPEEAYVYIYGENGPTEVYKYYCKLVVTNAGRQEYPCLGHASYTYGKNGMLEKIKCDYDDFIDYRKDHPSSINDMILESHDITYEFLYVTDKCRSGDYIWNHFEELYFPGSVTWVQIRMDQEGKLSTISGFEEHNGSYNMNEPPVVEMEYTCDANGNITSVNCVQTAGPGSYSIEYKLKNGHRQSGIQYDAYGNVTGTETYTYNPPEDMGNYTTTSTLEIDSVYEGDGGTKTIISYCDEQILKNSTIEDIEYWKNELQYMPMLRTACGL